MAIEISDDQVMELPIEDFNVDMVHVRQMVAQMTAELDRAIDSCNTSDDYKRWHEGMPIEGDAIRRYGEWPPKDLTGGAYAWQVLYHPGNGIIVSGKRSEGSLATICYFPNPATAISRLFGMERMEERWKSLNPDINLSRELFTTAKIGDLHAPDVVSNNLYNVMIIMHFRFRMLKMSRLWDEETVENIPF